jgi:curved DNA-binding protein CbpA
MGNRDVYSVLQVLPTAEDVVVHAAFRALARLYHPDGVTPDAGRMADLNVAYDSIRTPERRRTYEAAGEQPRPMGPGAPPVATAPPPNGYGEGAFARAAQRAGRPAADTSGKLDFGRYAGWSIAQLARQDPDYLRWLARHSSGLRYRRDIDQALDHADLAHRDRASA